MIVTVRGVSISYLGISHENVNAVRGQIFVLFCFVLFSFWYGEVCCIMVSTHNDDMKCNDGAGNVTDSVARL